MYFRFYNLISLGNFKAFCVTFLGCLLVWFYGENFSTCIQELHRQVRGWMIAPNSLSASQPINML